MDDDDDRPSAELVKIFGIRAGLKNPLISSGSEIPSLKDPMVGPKVRAPLLLLGERTGLVEAPPAWSQLPNWF